MTSATALMRHESHASWGKSKKAILQCKAFHGVFHLPLKKQWNSSIHVVFLLLFFDLFAIVRLHWKWPVKCSFNWNDNLALYPNPLDKHKAREQRSARLIGLMERTHTVLYRPYRMEGLKWKVRLVKLFSDSGSGANRQSKQIRATKRKSFQVNEAFNFWSIDFSVNFPFSVQVQSQPRIEIGKKKWKVIKVTTKLSNVWPFLVEKVRQFCTAWLQCTALLVVVCRWPLHAVKCEFVNSRDCHLLLRGSRTVDH